jgi:hypothetical protein
MTITAKQIRALSLSVATARRMGIETQVSSTGPAVLEQAEAILDRMVSRLEAKTTGAPSMSYDRDAIRLMDYADAVEALRNALTATVEEV